MLARSIFSPSCAISAPILCAQMQPPAPYTYTHTRARANKSISQSSFLNIQTQNALNLENGSLRNKKLPVIQKPKYSFSARWYRSDFDGGHLLKAKLSTIEDFHQSQKASGTWVPTEEKGRLIRNPISIWPTVTTIFASCSTFGCGGRLSGIKELHECERGVQH